MHFGSVNQMPLVLGHNNSAVKKEDMITAIWGTNMKINIYIYANNN